MDGWPTTRELSGQPVSNENLPGDYLLRPQFICSFRNSSRNSGVFVTRAASTADGA